jgi:exodeoxyribonuclease VII large subunit
VANYLLDKTMPPIITIKSPDAVLTVSQLNQQTKVLLEKQFTSVMVEGEISNCVRPSSGHYYFTLKDKNAQIRCAFFRPRQNGNQGKLEDGLQVIVRGKVSIYEPRGDYQLIIDNVEPAGLGALQKQFEELKKKLASLGLFEEHHKKTIPLFPKTIGVITSSTGAALRDILSTLKRRFAAIPVVIYPTEVQGKDAPKSIIRALHQAMAHAQADVIILARGGGSIEDLWAFNDEKLAHELFKCPIPIVSGIGHEIDFTIADFVADLRAATPTAAAEAVTPDGLELAASITKLQARLQHSISKLLEHCSLKLGLLQHRLSSPDILIQRHQQRIDNLELQLQQMIKLTIKQNAQNLNLLKARLINPAKKLEQTKLILNNLFHRLQTAMANKLHDLQQSLAAQIRTLRAVSPLATLERGYSITLVGEKVVTSIKQIEINQAVTIRLTDGHMQCKVEQKEEQ